MKVGYSAYSTYYIQCVNACVKPRVTYCRELYMLLEIAQGMIVDTKCVVVCLCVCVCVYCRKRDRRVNLGKKSKALMVIRDHQDPLVHLGHRARMESLVPQEDLDHV